jgi:hypothetical protein
MAVSTPGSQDPSLPGQKAHCSGVPPLLRLPAKAGDEHPSQQSPPLARTRAGHPSPPAARRSGLRLPCQHRVDTEVRGFLDQEGSSPCFPHSLNRRASACGSGRTPAPQPPPPHGGCRGAAVHEGAGARSTARYPQRFQTYGVGAPRLVTGYPQVFHKLARFLESSTVRSSRHGRGLLAPWRRAHRPPAVLLSTGFDAEELQHGET